MRRLVLFLSLLLSLSVAVAACADLTMTVLDVGQGDSTFLRFPDGRTMLVDAGDRDAGPVVAAKLRALSVDRIDVLVATHPHADHIGGMEDVLRAFPVGKVWDSGYAHGSKLQAQLYETIRQEGIRFGRPKAGFSEDIGGAMVQVLAPVRNLRDTGADANNNGLILRIASGDVSFLLMADAEEEERASVGKFPASTVLKVSHHGSRNGTDEAFLGDVRPEIAVISCGRDNPYGHPHRETLAALKSAEVKWYATTAGDVVISSDGHVAAVMGGVVGVPSVAEGAYIGNRKSHVFHMPSCDALPAKKNRVYFGTREEAIEAGYRPCEGCSP